MSACLYFSQHSLTFPAFLFCFPLHRDCRVVRDPQTLKSKGYGFVSFVKKSVSENTLFYFMFLKYMFLCNEACVVECAVFWVLAFYLVYLAPCDIVFFIIIFVCYLFGDLRHFISTWWNRSPFPVLFPFSSLLLAFRLSFVGQSLDTNACECESTQWRKSRTESKKLKINK